MNPTAIRNNTNIATKRVALFHTLGLVRVGISGISSRLATCSSVRLTHGSPAAASGAGGGRVQPEVSGRHVAARSGDLAWRACMPRSGFRQESRRSTRGMEIAGCVPVERFCRSAGSFPHFVGSARSRHRPQKVGSEAAGAQLVPQRRLLEVGFGRWPDDEAWSFTGHASGARKDGRELPPRALRHRDTARDRPGADRVPSSGRQ